MALRSANINVMVQAAHKAARHLVRDFGEVEHLQVSVKGPGDFVSAADRRAEQILRQELSQGAAELRPAARGERRGRRAATPTTAGSSTRSTAPPTSCTRCRTSRSRSRSSARASWSRAWSTTRSRTSCSRAEKGAGAYLNDRRLRVSRRSELATLPDRHRHPGARLAGPRQGLRRGSSSASSDEVAGIRRLGTASLDLAYVAAGRFDGFWEYDLKPWDMAAGIVLVREAGGLVGRLEGDDDLLGRGTLVAEQSGDLPAARRAAAVSA